MKKVLIIDEEILLIEPIIDRINYDFEHSQIIHVTTGAAGLNEMKSKTVDVVILDMMLPLGNGIILPQEEPDLMYGLFILREIRKLYPKLPVICYTVVNDESIIKQIESLQAFHICKLGQNNFQSLFSNLSNYLN